MKFEEYQKEWVQDCDINEHDLAGEAIRIPKLHSKWHTYLNNEKRLLHAMKQKMIDVEGILTNYFNRTMSMDELKKYELGEFLDKRVTGSEIKKAMDQHPMFIDIKLRHGQQCDKVDFLSDIIKSIHGRGYLIRDAIEWRKFQAGS